MRTRLNYNIVLLYVIWVPNNYRKYVYRYAENGSQNMLEAASLSKPIIFGPSVYNFEEISKQLLDNEASIQVASADELMKTISELILSDSKREKLGTNARKIFEDNKGAVNNVLDAITPYIKP